MEVDATRGTLDFTDALPIGAVALEPADRETLEAEIEARLPELTLYAETGIRGQLLAGRIEPADIIATRIETTTVGFAPRAALRRRRIELRDLPRQLQAGLLNGSSGT